MWSSFSRWHNSGDKVTGVFARQAIPMIYDFAEGNPFSNSTGNWMAHIQWVAKVVERLTADTSEAKAWQADASTTTHAGNGTVIVTDPPYYDNISYAQLSDFFYVWLRPLLRGIHPDLFSGIVTPKVEEMIAGPRFQDPRQRFEALLSGAMRRMRERCSDEFPSSIFYAYKQQQEEREGRTSTGWETMLNAVVAAGFQIVGTWPMRTELTERSNARGTNTLASSVVLVCRPRAADAPVATSRQFRDELARDLPPALDQLTREGHIAPTDLAQAAIGPGMQVYSRFQRVETLGGQLVTVRNALAAVNQAIADYDQQQEGSLDAPTRFCLAWRQQHGYREGPYGEAEVLSQAKNVAVDDLDAAGLLTAERGLVRLLPLDDYGPDRPRRLGSITAWEGCMRMAWHMLPGEHGGGVQGAAEVVPMLSGAAADAAERLARILYNHDDRAGDSANAYVFNTLVTSWTAIREKAQSLAEAPEQTEMDV